MPAKPAPYVPLPYVGEPYRDSGHARTLADLLLQRGNQAAAMHLQRGDNAARAWSQAGNVVLGAVDNWQQNVQLQRQQEMENAREARRAQSEGLQIQAAEMSVDRAKRQDKAEQFTRSILPLAKRGDGLVSYDREILQREFEAAGHADQIPQVFAALDEQEASHLKVIEARRDAVAADAFRALQSGADEETFGGLLEYWEANDVLPARELSAMRKAGKNPEQRQQALLAAVQSSPRFAKTLQEMRDAAEPKLHNVPAGTSVLDERNPQAGPLFTAPAAPEKPPALTFRDGIDPTTGRPAVLAFNPQTGEVKPTGVAPIPPRAAGGEAVSLQSREVLGEDGRPITVNFNPRTGTYTTPDGRVITNPRPASTREQGRQVTSGDAGDIAEFNTALDDLAMLRGELEGNGATGTAAQIGAALWTPITNLTGWGADAKSKQAQIDRVKQVIGKALEGGVLRKEDELKYEKILPTIKDSPELVRTKLNGLVTAIQKRQQRKLDALDSAGYDVSRFSTPGAESDGWQTIDGIRVRVKP